MSLDAGSPGRALNVSAPSLPGGQAPPWQT